MLILFLLIFSINFFYHSIEGIIQGFELLLERIVMFFLLLNYIQPKL